MIYILSEDKNRYIEEYMESNSTIFSVKIYIRYKSYICKEIYDIWVQVVDDKAVALISSNDGYVTIDTTCKADMEEIKRFLDIIGSTEVISRYDNKLICSGKYTGYSMEYEYKDKISKRYLYGEFDIISNDYKSAYDVLELCKSKDFIIPSYEEFILGMSNKVRKRTGEVITINKNKSPIATASIVSCSYGAIIESVGVIEEFRRIGIARYMFDMMISQIMNSDIKKIYVQCNTEENKNIYKKLNFKEVNKFINYTYEVKRNGK